MKSRSESFVIAMTLVAAMVAPLGLAAQDQPDADVGGGVAIATGRTAYTRPSAVTVVADQSVSHPSSQSPSR